MPHVRYDCGVGCPVAATGDVIGGKWKGTVLFLLLEGPLRFNALQRSVGEVAARTLSLTLRELAADGLIVRSVSDGAPPAVTDALTDRGQALRPALQALGAWGVDRVAAMDGPLPNDPAVRRALGEAAAS